MTTCRFSCGSELADLLVSSDLLDHSWSAISSLINDDGDNLSEPTATSTFSVKFKAYTQQHQQPSYTIIAFVSSPSCTKHHQQGEAEAEAEGEALVLSPTLQQNHPLFEFLCTKETPSLSINKEALTLFISLFEKLSLLNLQLGHTSSTSTSLIIITGHSLGGSVASLFALWLLENIPLSTTTNLPLCITFGSPLIGDDGLRRALSDRPTWNSRFLHLVSNQDLLPRLFISLQERENYKPFGTFLMCSQLGCACFEDPILVLELMKVATKGELQVDYGEILKHLKDRILYKGSSKLHGLSSLLQAGIVLQLEAIGLMKIQQQQQQNNEFDSLIASMEQREQQNHTYQKRRVSYSNKKLNEMKINMALLEWYKKVGKAAGIGYYDCYKRRQSQRDMDVVKYKTNLSNYWKDMVREAERMPQKEGFFFWISWLCAGTNYRRMVEPLDIADYCKKPGWKDYQTEGRSHHYKLLEKWLEEAQRASGDQNTKTRNMASSLTEDSCFWAHVEEAINLTKSLNKGEEASQSAKTEKEKLMNFESYVMGLINNCSVSPEIFLEGSSFRQWWREYEIILEPAYSSSLADFMRNHSYQQYT